MCRMLSHWCGTHHDQLFFTSQIAKQMSDLICNLVFFSAWSDHCRNCCKRRSYHISCSANQLDFLRTLHTFNLVYHICCIYKCNICQIFFDVFIEAGRHKPLCYNSKFFIPIFSNRFHGSLAIQAVRVVNTTIIWAHNIFFNASHHPVR